MENIFQKLSKYKLVPVVTSHTPQKAVMLSDTLKENGLPLIEITFRTDAAEESIRLIRKKHSDLCIGAGTILSIDQVDAAKRAGADFVVAPGFNPTVVDYCIKNKIPIIPGIDSPTLIEAALEKGIKLVKFYPAQASGGIEYLKAIAGPYRDIRLMPTGGINPDNMNDYLDFEKVVACGASWIAPSSLISGNKFDKIAQRIDLALNRLR